jgi:pimeloyl-ACP methyl ester carboxylesterase
VWWLALSVIGAACAGLAYQWLGERRDARRLPAPGRMAAGLHIHTTGRGAPPVVLEAGIAASSLSWRLVERDLARRTTVLAYDRAGFGWSPPAGPARTMRQLVEELRRGLEASGTAGPFVLVGHSFGGLLLRHFALAHPDQVRALVLVDPLEPFEWRSPGVEQARRLGKGVELARRGALLARFGVVRLGLGLLLAGSRAVPKLLARISSGKGSVVPDRLAGEIGKLPPEVWPAVCAHWCRPRSFHLLAEYLERLPEHCAPDAAVPRAIPVTVISAAANTAEVQAAHGRTAAASEQGRHVVAAECGHWVQLDRPEVVVEEVRRAAGI